MSSEADVIAEFDHRLRSAIEEQSTYYNTEFTGISRELYIESAQGFADLVLETGNEDPFLVIEAKRQPEEEPDRSVDPYSQEVISQAANYAFHLGAEYFATYNSNRLVLFRTMERGTNLLDRKSLAYEVKDLSAFVPEFLQDVAGLEVEEVEWDPHQDAFIKRLGSFHDLTKEQFDTLLRERLETDAEFKSRYEEWVKGQGWQEKYEKDPNEIHASFASQSAYLLMNKLVFYKLLDGAEAYVNVPEIDIEQLVDAEMRRRTFDTLIEQVDFEVVYEQDPIFDSLRLTERTQREVSSLLEDLEDYNLDQFDHDVIGQIYEEIIPPDERHSLGQYYTPKEIVELIIGLTVESSDDTILDPGCGSGGFLVGGYNKINSLSDSKGHEEILDQIYGVDINRFPAHLSAINLALRDLSTETHDTNIIVEDFFNLIESQERVVSAERADIGSNGGNEGEGDGNTDVEIPPTIDVAVANPPYIRNENIANEERVRGHLKNSGVDLSERSDIFCYFFTHAYEFLREGDGDNQPGRMGYLTSNRWLTAGYGKDLQEFLLNNTKIKAIIDFQTQQFDVPLISTCVTILERCDDEEERNENFTELLHVQQELSPGEIIEILETDHEAGTLEDEEQGRYRRVTLRQGDLYEIDRWDRYLYAPGVYWDFVDHEQVCQFEEIADPNFGTKTGNNDYFYFESKEEYEEFGLDDRFVTPILKHIAQTEYIRLTNEDPTWYVLDLHDIVTEILSKTQNSIMEQRSYEEILMDEFEARGWDNLIQYLKVGREQDVHEGTSVQNIGKVWFDVGELPIAQIILPKEYWRDSRVLWNEAGIPLDQRNMEVDLTDNNVDPFVLLGIMNSSIFPLMREIEGQREQGQAMDRNELKVEQAEELRIPDPRTFSDKEYEEIKRAIQEWMNRERAINADGDQIEDWNNPDEIEESAEQYQEQLDRAVLSAMGIEEKLEIVQQAVDELVADREAGGGESTSVLVSTDEEGGSRGRGREIEIPGAKRIQDKEEQSNLDSF